MASQDNFEKMKMKAAAIPAITDVRNGLQGIEMTVYAANENNFRELLYEAADMMGGTLISRVLDTEAARQGANKALESLMKQDEVTRTGVEELDIILDRLNNYTDPDLTLDEVRKLIKQARQKIDELAERNRI